MICLILKIFLCFRVPDFCCSNRHWFGCRTCCNNFPSFDVVGCYRSQPFQYAMMLADNIKQRTPEKHISRNSNCLFQYVYAFRNIHQFHRNTTLFIFSFLVIDSFPFIVTILQEWLLQMFYFILIMYCKLYYETLKLQYNT